MDGFGEGQNVPIGDPVVQISPLSVAGEAEMDEIVSILGDAPAEASKRMRLGG